MVKTVQDFTALVDALLERGATFIKVDGVEVHFNPGYLPVKAEEPEPEWNGKPKKDKDTWRGFTAEERFGIEP